MAKMAKISIENVEMQSSCENNQSGGEEIGIK